MSDTVGDVAARLRFDQQKARVQVRVDPAVYAGYVGAYRFIDDGTYYFVETREGRLFARILGQTESEIFPESQTRFFMKGAPVQITFLDDGRGAVNSLAYQANGADVRGVRVDPAEAAAAEADLERRRREKIPHPQSEEVLRRIIEAHQRGAPSYAAMTPVLANALRQQRQSLQSTLQIAGKLRTLSFRGVGQSGLDVYDTVFERSWLEWAIGVGSNGWLIAFTMRPSL